MTTSNKWLLGLLITCLFLCCDVSRGHALCPGEASRATAAAGRVEREWPLRDHNDAVSRYVFFLGRRLGIAANGEPLPWNFTVLRDHAAYAFTVGNGNIYISEGALRLAETESELAAILAHEIGHQVEGHFCTEESGSSSFLDLFSGAEKKRQLPVGSFSQQIDIAKETQADTRAIRILTAAGCDPRALMDIVQRLPGKGSLHYSYDERRILALKRELSDVPRKATPTGEEFQAMKKGLMKE